MATKSTATALTTRILTTSLSRNDLTTKNKKSSVASTTTTKIPGQKQVTS